MLHRFTRHVRLPSVGALVFVTGCAGSFQVVQEARGGGTLALHGSEEGARAKADQHMKARCPAGYEVVEQGESFAIDGDREWRITYACAPSARVARAAL